jgi:hypothetical protein
MGLTKEQAVYAGFSGWGFYLTAKALGRIPKGLLEELEVVECPVVECEAW